MDENDYHQISELLKRRDSQREYLNHSRKNVAACEEGVATHALEIQMLNQRLYKLGYTGQ